MQIEITTGENDSDSQVVALDLAVKGGGGGHGPRWFDGAAQVLRDHMNRVYNFLFSNEQYAIDALAQDRERARRQIRPQAVRNREFH